MPAPLSFDIRHRFQRLIKKGVSGREAGRRLLISAASASRLGSKIANGEDLTPKPSGGRKGGGKLAGHHDFLIELIEQDPDITLFELRDALASAHDLKVREYPELCVSALTHAGFRYGHALKRSSNKIANWFLAANHSLTVRPLFSNFRMAR